MIFNKACWRSENAETPGATRWCLKQTEPPHVQQGMPEWRSSNLDVSVAGWALPLVRRAMLWHQKGRCEICGTLGDAKLGLDHCHQTGQVRGLLCTSCNLTVGLVERGTWRATGHTARCIAYIRHYAKLPKARREREIERLLHSPDAVTPLPIAWEGDPIDWDSVPDEWLIGYHPADVEYPLAIELATMSREHVQLAIRELPSDYREQLWVEVTAAQVAPSGKACSIATRVSRLRRELGLPTTSELGVRVKRARLKAMVAARKKADSHS